MKKIKIRDSGFGFRVPDSNSRSFRVMSPSGTAATGGRRPAAGISPLLWREHQLVLLDQTLLPAKVSYFRTRDYRGVIAAIKRLAVRGAPLIGVAGALGVVQEAFRLLSGNATPS